MEQILIFGMETYSIKQEVSYLCGTHRFATRSSHELERFAARNL